MTTYTVTVTREENLWVADASSGAVGPAAMDYEHLAELHDDMPSFLADLLGVDENDVVIEYRYVVNERDVTDELGHLLDTERRLHDVTAEREQARRETLAAMAAAGVSQRVIADALGVSHQRVNQLVNS